MNPPTPRFGFYEVVRVTPESKTPVAGYSGVVSGRTETSDGKSFYYSVWIEDDGANWCFFEHELESQNRFVDPQTIMSRQVVRVRSDEHGRGTIIPD